MEEQIFYNRGFMDLSPYRLVRTWEAPAWDSIVENSDQGSIFASSDFLQNLRDSRPAMWLCLKGSETKAAVLVMESEDGGRCIFDDFVIHSGIMFLPPPHNQSNAQSIAENFRVTASAVSELTRNYDKVFISTHPSFVDLRPFQWHNYGNPGPKFHVDVRFTTRIRLEGIDTGEPLDRNPVYLSSSKSRRQEIRYGIQKRVETTTTNDVDALLKLYRLTFDRQGETIDDNTCQRLEGLIKGLLAAGRARMYISRTAAGDAGSIAVFGMDSKRAYYLFGANDPALHSQHTGTMVLWDAFLDLAALGVKEVDLEGINSPLRGHFKLSFGGTITPYYHLHLCSD